MTEWAGSASVIDVGEFLPLKLAGSDNHVIPPQTSGKDDHLEVEWGSYAIDRKD